MDSSVIANLSNRAFTGKGNISVRCYEWAGSGTPYPIKVDTN